MTVSMMWINLCVRWPSNSFIGTEILSIEFFFLPWTTFVNNWMGKRMKKKRVWWCFKLFIYYLYHLKCWKCVRDECISFKNFMIKNVSGIKNEACFFCLNFCTFHDKYWYSIVCLIYMARHYEYIWFFFLQKTKRSTKKQNSLNNHIHD